MCQGLKKHFWNNGFSFPGKLVSTTQQAQLHNHFEKLPPEPITTIDCLNDQTKSPVPLQRRTILDPLSFGQTPTTIGFTNFHFKRDQNVKLQFANQRKKDHLPDTLICRPSHQGGPWPNPLGLIPVWHMGTNGRPAPINLNKPYSTTNHEKTIMSQPGR